MRIYEGNFFFVHNMGLGFGNLQKSISSLVGWFTWVLGIIVFCQNWKGSFAEMHEEGYDIVLMVIVAIQVFIRCAVIAIKYATFT